MKKYLLDTNIISELGKPFPDQKIVHFCLNIDQSMAINYHRA